MAAGADRNGDGDDGRVCHRLYCQYPLRLAGLELYTHAREHFGADLSAICFILDSGIPCRHSCGRLAPILAFRGKQTEIQIDLRRNEV